MEKIETDAGWRSGSVMIGQSPSFVRAIEILRRFAGCDAPVLIEGETGTGKRAPLALGARARADGRREAHWATRAACVDRENRRVLYYWEGEHYQDAAEPFGGFGEITFDPEAGRIDRGHGIFSDQSLLRAGPLKKKHVDLRRATPDEIGTMRNGTAAAVKALVGRKLRALG